MKSPLADRSDAAPTTSCSEEVVQVSGSQGGGRRVWWAIAAIGAVGASIAVVCARWTRDGTSSERPAGFLGLAGPTAVLPPPVGPMYNFRTDGICSGTDAEFPVFQLMQEYGEVPGNVTTNGTTWYTRPGLASGIKNVCSLPQCAAVCLAVDWCRHFSVTLVKTTSCSCFIHKTCTHVDTQYPYKIYDIVSPSQNLTEGTSRGVDFTIKVELKRKRFGPGASKTVADHKAYAQTKLSTCIKAVQTGLPGTTVTGAVGTAAGNGGTDEAHMYLMVSGESLSQISDRKSAIRSVIQTVGAGWNHARMQDPVYVAGDASGGLGVTPIEPSGAAPTTTRISN